MITSGINVVTTARPAWFPENYTHPEFIARGGQAEVWRARAISGPSPVAIKRYFGPVSSSFYKETGYLIELQSDHVVQLYDLVDTLEGGKLVVLEYCSGGTLRTLLHSKNRLSVRRTLDVGRQIARALLAVHRLDIAHGDVKPENIFLSRNIGAPRWKLADFGLARHPGQLPGKPSLTPAYACPCQFSNHLTYESDVYSLAVVMLECITGHRPQAFKAKDLLVHVNEASLHRFLAHCLEKDPRDRPSMKEFFVYCKRRLMVETASNYLSDESRIVLKSAIEEELNDN